MLCFPHLQLYEKGEEEKNEVVLPLARNGEAKTRRTSLSIFNSPIFPTELYIDKDVKYWKSILAYGLHWCVVFSWYFVLRSLCSTWCNVCVSVSIMWGKSGKARRRIFSWILNLLSFTSTIPYFLRKAIYRPPQNCLTALRFIYEQKDDDLLEMFWRWSLKRWMSQGCVPLSPCVKNRFYAETPSLQLPPPDSTQITTFKSEAAKVLSAPPPWSDQKLVTDKINFHLSPYGRVWSSGSRGDYPRKRVIGPSSQYHRHTLDWPGRITEGKKVVREEQICEVSSMCIVLPEGMGSMCLKSLLGKQFVRKSDFGRSCFSFYTNPVFKGKCCTWISTICLTTGP